jgi:hypothetical protein
MEQSKSEESPEKKLDNDVNDDNPKRSRASTRSHRSFSNFSLDSFRVFSGDFEYLQDYGAKMIEVFNSKINSLFTVKTTQKTLSFAFWFLYSLLMVRFIVFPAIYLSKKREDQETFFTPAIISKALFNIFFLLFEFVTTSKLNEIFQISSYTLNVYIFFTVCIVCAIDGVIRFHPVMDTFFLVYYSLRTAILFPICFILFSMSFEMSEKLHTFMTDCCHDPRLSIQTYEIMVIKETAIINTRKFVVTLASAHAVVEFKLLADLFFSVWAIINAMYFSQSSSIFFATIALVTLLLLSSMSQPFYLQRVIKRIERKNGVSLNFAIKVLNIEASYLWIMLPILTAVVGIGKSFLGLHYCSTQN